MATLLEIVQSVLSLSNGEEVNSISDSVEASDAAEVVKLVYDSLVAQRTLKEHYSLFKLVPYSDSLSPTSFKYPSNVRGLKTLWYNVAADGSPEEWKQLCYLEPEEFLSLSDSISDDYLTVEDNFGFSLRIRTHTQPTYWTSFDDNTVLIDAFDSRIDDTLIASKTRAYGVLSSFLEISDTALIDIDDGLVTYLKWESAAVYQDIHMGGVKPKVEQGAKRARVFTKNHNTKELEPNRSFDFGRR